MIRGALFDMFIAMIKLWVVTARSLRESANIGGPTLPDCRSPVRLRANGFSLL